MFRVLAFSILLVSAGSASAGPCVDVNAGFDPSSAQTWDRVTFSGSLANTGDEGGVVTVRVTVAFNESSYGPVEGHLYLTAGRELSQEIPFLVRPAFPSGTLTLTIESQAGECSDTAVATLVIEATDGPPPGEGDLQAVASSILAAYGMIPTPTEPISWGALKTRFGG